MKTDKLNEQFNELLQRRADEIGVSPEDILLQQEEVPLFLSAAQERGKRLGISAEEVLAQDLARLRESKYPGPECLQTYEVEEYVETGKLSAAMQAHIDECKMCEILLIAATPNRERMEEVIAAAREDLSQVQKISTTAENKQSNQQTSEKQNWFQAVASRFTRSSEK